MEFIAGVLQVWTGIIIGLAIVIGAGYLIKAWTSDR